MRAAAFQPNDENHLSAGFTAVDIQVAGDTVILFLSDHTDLDDLICKLQAARDSVFSKQPVA